MSAFLLSSERLSLDGAIQAVAGTDAGAIVTFLGTVRGAAKDGRRVVRLEYEAYEDMALEQLAAFAQEAAAKWPGVRVAVHHRLGSCPPGEPAVVIACASPHRPEAFAACRYVLERLKADLALWKREVYEDGSIWVGQGS